MSWAFAALLRPQALPVFFAASLALLAHFASTTGRRAGSWALAACLGLLIVVAPAADHCTRAAEGHWCAISNNVAMNIALGQAGRSFGLEFRDPADPKHMYGDGLYALGHLSLHERNTASARSGAEFD
jgi:hypothetical protein